MIGRRCDFIFRSKLCLFEVAVNLFVTKLLHFSILASLFFLTNDSPEVFISNVAIASKESLVVNYLYILEVTDEVSTNVSSITSYLESLELYEWKSTRIDWIYTNFAVTDF